MSYTITGTSWGDKLRKAAITGGIAYTAGYVFGEDGRTSLLGMDVSMPMALAGSTAIGSMAADLSHDYVLPMIPGNDKWVNPESALLGLGVSGGTSAVLLNGGDVFNGSSLNTFMLGAGSYAAGEWVDRKFFSMGGVPTLGYW